MRTSFLFFLQKNWRTCTTIFLVVITALSLWPLSLPAAPGGDKLHHLLAYAVLVFPVSLRRPRWWQLIVILFIVYSGLIELVQPLVNRYGEWLDMAANSAGLLCGILVTELLRRWGTTLKAPDHGSRGERP